MQLPSAPDVLAVARLYGAPFYETGDVGSITVKGSSTSLAHRQDMNNFAWWNVLV